MSNSYFLNRRDFARVDLSLALLKATLGLHSYNGVRSPVTSTSEVGIIDFSAGGLRFLSDLVFPVNLGIVIRLKFNVEDISFDELGELVWANKNQYLLPRGVVNASEYGFRFLEMSDHATQVRVKATFNLERIFKTFGFRVGLCKTQFDINPKLYQLWIKMRSDKMK